MFKLAKHLWRILFCIFGIGCWIRWTTHWTSVSMHKRNSAFFLRGWFISIRIWHYCLVHQIQQPIPKLQLWVLDHCVPMHKRNSVMKWKWVPRPFFLRRWFVSIGVMSRFNLVVQRSTKVVFFLRAITTHFFSWAWISLLCRYRLWKFKPKYFQYLFI